MYDFDLVKLNSSLVAGVKLAMATKRLLGKANPGYESVGEIERGLREAAAECQRVLECLAADGNRPLIIG